MTSLINPGRKIFAAGMIGLGILCFIQEDFIVGRPPAWPAGVEVNPFLGYLSGVVLIVSALAIILGKRGDMAALVIAGMILLLSILPRHLPNLMTDWLNTYKAMALFGGALIIFLSDKNSYGISESLKRKLIFFGCVMLSIFFVAAGYAHFKFAGFVNDFIPAYIPFRPFWTYFCGICLIAGGVGILIPKTRRLAALLSGVMVMGWFFLLHIPRFLTDTSNISDRLGLCESFAIAGIFFVLAGLFSRAK